MTLVDTNVILRWLLNDHPTLSRQAERIIEQAPDGDLLITDVVLAEIVYVLRQKGLSSKQIAETIAILAEQAAFTLDQEPSLELLIRIISETTLDFADCYLICRAVSSNQSLQTFDKAMLKAYNRYKLG